MKHIQKKEILEIVISVLILSITTVALCKQNWKDAFAKTKQIINIVELNECKEGDWVNLKVSRAYDTGYWYEEEGMQVAKFIDIEVNGNVCIAVVEKEKAEEILQNEGEYMQSEYKVQNIEGVLQKLEGEMAQKYKTIQQNYIEDFSEELTEEEVLSLFTTMQLVNYNVQKPQIILPVLLAIVEIASLVWIVSAVARIEFARKREK